MSLSAARSRVMFAKENLSSPGRLGEVEPLLQAAEGFLADVDDDDRAEVLAEIARIRAELVALPSPDETRLTRAAQGKITQALEQIERGYNRDDVLVTLRVGEEYLQEVRDQFRAPVLDELDRLRAQLGVAAAPTPAPASPTSGPAEQLSEDDERAVSTVRRLLTWARESAGNPMRLEDAELKVEQALGQLAALPDALAAKRELLAEIEAIRALAVESANGEKIAAVRRMLDAELSAAESTKEYDFGNSRGYLAKFHERLGRDEAKVLPDAVRQEYQARAAALAAEVDGQAKADALERADGRMRDIEQLAASDPYEGLRDDQVAQLGTNLEHFKNQLLDYLRRIPPGDPDVAAMRERLGVAETRLDAYALRWNERRAEQTVSTYWAAQLASIEGWAEEAIDAAPPSMYAPSLGRTMEAIRLTRSFLEYEDYRRIHEQYPGNAAIQTAWQQAEAVVANGTAKVYAAFERSLEHFERMPSPMVEDDVLKTVHLSGAADTMLADTPYRQPVLDRIEALSARWRTDYAELLEGRRKLLEARSADADERWPAIVAASGASGGFDPWDDGSVGQTVLLAQVHNRCGWEWSGREYGFAVKHQAKVIGGVWAPHVFKALEHAWYELKLEVSDRQPWDVIAVVEGPATIGERTTKTLIDQRSGNPLGTTEEWPDVPCVRLRVVGLHAGPVAIGPEGDGHPSR